MKKILLFIPFIFLFAACSQDNEIIAENDDSTNFPKEQKETDGMMVLGEKHDVDHGDDHERGLFKIA